MRIVRFSGFCVGLALAGCGNRVEARHAPVDPSQGVDQPGPERNGIACSEGERLSIVDGREFCAPNPTAQGLTGFSLAGFSLLTTGARCEALRLFSVDFAKNHMPDSTLTWTSCSEQPGGFLVKLTATGNGGSAEFTYVAGFRRGAGDAVSAPFVRICPNSNATETSLCIEPYVFGDVPSDVARVYPVPHKGMVHYYSTLVSFLKR